MNKILVLYLAYFILWTLAAVGYFMNLFKILTGFDGGLTTLMIVRLIGTIVFPLGAIVGWAPNP